MISCQPAIRAVFEDPDVELKFRRDGYVVMPLLNAAAVEELTEVHARLISDVPSDHFFSTSCPPSVRQKIFASIGEVVAPRLKQLLPDYRNRSNCFVDKRPKGKKGFLGLHRDPAFVAPGAEPAIHVWCPLVDVDERNGCVKVVAGSHQLAHVMSLPYNPTPWDSLSHILESEFMKSIPMKAGHALIYDGRLLHASGPNLSKQLRIATASVLIPNEITPRVYVSNPALPTDLKVFELSDELFSVNGYLEMLGPPPYPSGAAEIDTVEYLATPLTLAQVEYLRPSIPPTNAQSAMRTNTTGGGTVTAALKRFYNRVAQRKRDA